MSAVDFFDSNVLVYVFDTRDPRRSSIAQGLLAHAQREHNAVISAQVVQETLNVLVRKLTPRMSAADACKVLPRSRPPMAHPPQPRALHARTEHPGALRLQLLRQPDRRRRSGGWLHALAQRRLAARAADRWVAGGEPVSRCSGLSASPEIGDPPTPAKQANGIPYQSEQLMSSKSTEIISTGS